jgi:hypothetical protein
MTDNRYKVDYTTVRFPWCDVSGGNDMRRVEDTITAYYDDEADAETSAVRFLGTKTRLGALISASKVFSPEGKLLNEFEF